MDTVRYNTYLQSARTKTITQLVDAFNQKSRGGIVMRDTSKNMGDVTQEMAFANTAGLVRTRNANSNAAVASKTLQQTFESSVKVAAGIGPIDVTAVDYTWMGQNPDKAGAIIGRQSAVGTMAWALNTAVGSAIAAISNEAALRLDATGDVATHGVMGQAASLFGDRYSEITCWIMHSKVWFDLYQGNLDNEARLFEIDNVKVGVDPLGKIYVLSDSPSLVVADGVSAGINKYYTLGLVSGGLTVDMNADYHETILPVTNKENIVYTRQGEFSANIGVKGFQWDETNGGSSPNQAALGASTNWDKATGYDSKDLAGVILETR